MLLEWMDFLVETQKKYYQKTIPAWKNMVNQALYAILDNISPTDLISKMNNENDWLMKDNDLVSKTMNHFRELRGMFNASKQVNTSDWWENYKKISDRLNIGVYTNLSQKLCPCTMVFEECGHSFPFSSNDKMKYKNTTVFCDKCEKINPSKKSNISILLFFFYFI